MRGVSGAGAAEALAGLRRERGGLDAKAARGSGHVFLQNPFAPSWKALGRAGAAVRGCSTARCASAAVGRGGLSAVKASRFEAVLSSAVLTGVAVGYRYPFHRVFSGRYLSCFCRSDVFFCYQ